MALPGVATQNTADLMQALTGLPFTPEEVQAVGERVNNLARIYNKRAGFSRADDTFPARIMTEPLKEGNSKGQLISKEDLDIMLDEYYAARGWTKEGVPTPEKLHALGLENVVKYLD
jgi:aldehyde:ferredoxin oxidoreductase